MAIVSDAYLSMTNGLAGVFYCEPWTPWLSIDSMQPFNLDIFIFQRVGFF